MHYGKFTYPLVLFLKAQVSTPLITDLHQGPVERQPKKKLAKIRKQQIQAVKLQQTASQNQTKIEMNRGLAPAAM